jgi:hypothetical protein
MTDGTVESGTAGFPEQIAPAQRLGGGGAASSDGSANEPITSGSSASASAADSVREVM